jgi:peptidoglycan hydrolase-like protein with peptidoglycan-binding domain
MNTTAPITSAVGNGGFNNTADVKLVQMLLNNWLRKANKQPLKVDGIIGPKTIKEITDYQRSFGGVIDGRIDPNGPTIKTLVSLQIELLQQGVSTPIIEMAKRRLYQNPHQFISSAQGLDIAAVLNEYFQSVKRG